MTKTGWMNLTAAVLAGLMGTVGTQGVMAKEYNQAITGYYDDIDVFGDDIVKEKGDTLIYDLKGDNTFSGRTGVGYSSTTVGLQEGKTVINSEGTLTLKSSGIAIKGLIAAANGADAVINGNVVGVVDNTNTGKVNTLGGIVLSDGYQKPDDKATHLTFNGDVDLHVTTTGKNGYNGDGGDNYTGSRWTTRAVSIGFGGGSFIDFNGNVKIYSSGIGVSTGAYYTYPGFSSYDAAVINMNKGDVTISTPDNTAAAVYSLAGFGGTTNINVTPGAAGTDAKEYTPGTNKVTLYGNMIVMKNDKGDANEFYYRDSRLNVGLTTKDSSWTGVVDNTGTTQVGEVNLWLTNGANWYHKNPSMINGMDADHMPRPSIDFYGNYDGITYINWLHGGEKGADGFVTQSEKTPIHIANYSGYATFIYDHENSGTTTSDYTGGALSIGHAESGSQITLSTSSKNIDINNADQVNQVLNALAGKLTYSAYTNGENHLRGKVQIASGLLSTSTELMIGDITFDKTSGQGGSTGGGTSQEDEYSSGITGDPSKDAGFADVIEDDGTYRFKNNVKITVADAQPAVDLAGKTMTLDAEGRTIALVSSGEKGPLSGLAAAVNMINSDLTVHARQLNISMDRTNDKWATGITLGAMGSDAKQTLAVDGNVNIDVAGGSAVQGIYALGNSSAVIDGDLKVKVNNRASGYEGTNVAHYATNALFAGDNGASIKVTGDVDLSSNGTGVQANKNSRIDILGGGQILLEKNTKSAHYALNAEGAAVNMNVAEDKDGKITGAGTKDVKIKGNIGALNKNYGAAPNTGAAPTVINLALTTADSTLEGVAFNEFAEENAAKSAVMALDRDAEPVATGAINLYIQNGAAWTNESWGAVKQLAPEQEGKIGHSFTGSKVNTLIGGSDAVHAGYIIQKDSHDISVGNYSGHMVVIYDHENDGTEAADYKAGNTVIGKALAGSGIIASTSSQGINTNDRSAVEATLTALAQKLIYTAADENLKGQVQIASGLLSTSQALKLGDLTWDENGTGNYVVDSVRDVSLHVGSTESYMMKGVRSAAVTAYMSFRDAASDVLHRTEFLKDGAVTEGIWAKTYGGKSRYDGSDLNNKYNYWGAQVGYNRDMGHGWQAGLGLDYQDGDSDYILGGKGDNKLYTLGVYANKNLGGGAYFDAAVKMGHVENDFHVYNEIGEKLSGRYSAEGYSASMQVGKRIGGTSYIEPQLQFTYAHLGGANYDTHSELGTMHVAQDAYDSLVGRVGLEVGSQNDKGGFYGRVSIAHEFKGDVNTDYGDNNGGHKKTSFDTNDTWSEFTLGGQYQANEDTRIYADLTRSIGGNYQTQWKANAGVRVFLGSGVAPGSRKVPLPVSFAPKAATVENAVSTEGTGNAATAHVSEEVTAKMPATEGNTAIMAGGTSVAVHTAPAGSSSETYVVPAENTGASYTGRDTGNAPFNAGSAPVFELAPVVVTANRVPQPVLEAKADISVVSRKEIEDMHMGTVEEVLRTVPGVQFLNYGANGLNANLSGLRINGSKDIVVLVDGVRVNDFQGAGTGGYMYASLLSNMDNIERVEVLRGAAGTLYGSAAKGGVINIITRKVNGTQTVVDVSHGSFGKENYKLNTQGRAGNFSYNAYFNKNFIGNTKDGDGKTWPGHTNTRNYGVKTSYDLTKNQTITMYYDETNSKYSGRDFVYTNDYEGSYKTKSFTIRHDYKISDLWRNAIIYRWNNTKYFHSQHYYANDQGNSPAFADFTYHFLSDQATYTSDRHTVTFGVDYSKARDNTLNEKYNIHHAMSNVSLYAQDDWKLLPSVTLSGGIRHDQPDGDAYSPDFDSHTSYSYKLSWDMTDKDTVYAGRSDYFILPGMGQIYDKKYGNAKLQPAEGRTDSIGYNRKFSDKHILTVNWFETDTARGIGYTKDGVYTNYSNGTSRGWNAQWIAQFNDNWSARLGWAHLFQYEGGDENFAMGYYPKDLATFSVYYNKDKWTAAFDGFYFIRKINPDYDSKAGWPSDKYGVYNLSASYSPNKNLTFYGKIENIFNQLYAEQTGGIWGKGPGSWYALPGRSFLLGMQMKF